MRADTSDDSLVGYPRIKMVGSFDELIGTPFRDGVNALCWRRELPGDFAAVVRAVGALDEITTIDDESLRALDLSAAGRVARDILLEDQRLLQAHGLSPILDCIPAYPRDVSDEPVPTDVYSFHVDSATTETDTWLCTYHGASSEGLSNEAAIRRVDVPATRAALLKAYGGQDDADFRIYLAEHCYDLHYVPQSNAQLFAFGVGNLWRIATAWPGCLVPPCIHRAPATRQGHPPRLLLIS
jgi:hypothetical protein|uniref:hypothetical protein n=1 Tax=Cephaloticoccus sp. TaxID=1985742 RepID=UPI00404A2249